MCELGTNDAKQLVCKQTRPMHVQRRGKMAAEECAQLDVLHVDGLVDAGHLVELLCVLAQVWVLAYALLVALEVDHIHLHGTQTCSTAQVRSHAKNTPTHPIFLTNCTRSY